MRRRYRIVQDSSTFAVMKIYYTVQVRGPWPWSRWKKAEDLNRTSCWASSIESAEHWAQQHANGYVVKDLGWLP